MSDLTSQPPRPVSLITTLFVLALFAAFFFVVRHYYRPAETSAYAAAPENLSKELEWKASRASRQKTLQELHLAESERTRSYGWVDQKAGTVQLPLDRAMELTARQYGKQKQ